MKVEWACISLPHALISMGLETWNEDPMDRGLSDAFAIEDILKGTNFLGLVSEPLREMNYMDAVEIWAKQKVITAR